MAVATFAANSRTEFQENSMQRTRLAVLAVLGTLVVSAPTSLAAQDRHWGEGHIPNLPVITQEGKTLRFYDNVIKGKVVVMNFIYTNCPDICGLTTASLAQAADKLGDAVGRDVFFVSLTVDPEHDTPGKLKQYADAFHIGPRWMFLTGKLEDIQAINAKFGQRSLDLTEHRQQVLLGNDATGEWARNSVLGDIERFVMDVRAMIPKRRDQMHTSEHSAASDTGYQLTTAPGQALFKKLMRAVPHHWSGQPRRPRSAGRHLSPRARMAHSIHHGSLQAANAQRSARTRSHG